MSMHPLICQAWSGVLITVSSSWNESVSQIWIKYPKHEVNNSNVWWLGIKHEFNRKVPGISMQGAVMHFLDSNYIDSDFFQYTEVWWTINSLWFRRKFLGLYVLSWSLCCYPSDKAAVVYVAFVIPFIATTTTATRRGFPYTSRWPFVLSTWAVLSIHLHHYEITET